MTLPAPGTGNPEDLVAAGTPNFALATNQAAWDTYVTFVSSALPVAFNDLVDIQLTGGIDGKSPGPGSFA